MIDNANYELIAALRDPSRLTRLDLQAWEQLIAQSRSANLHGWLATRLLDEGGLDDVPTGPRAHLQSALIVSQAQQTTVMRELNHLRQALETVETDVVLLKGAAYVLAGLSVARGRMFTDIDLLVPRSHLADVEAALMLRGWATTHHDAYDQRYYRQWMHELPPMLHVTRGTVVDVHHAILPSTARFHPDSNKLLESARPISGESRFRVLAPVDMILHSMTHLFHNEELEQGLRDLVDINGLIRSHDPRPGFWSDIVSRAAELDLLRSLYYGLRYVSAILGTPIPSDVVKATAGQGPPRPLPEVMDSLFLRALRPAHPSTSDHFTSIARTLLYVRAHWLRMPPLLLARHLTIKAFRSTPEAAI